jgi:hypothetical protein
MFVLVELDTSQGIATSIGMLLGLFATHWLLAKRLLPWLQRRNMVAPPGTVFPAPWRMAFIASPATVVLLIIAGFAQTAHFFPGL